MAKDDFAGSDRRKYFRLPEEDVLLCEPFTAAALEGSGFGRHGFTRSLSEGGILFDTDAPFEIGKLLKIELELPGWEKFERKFFRPDAPVDPKPLVVIGKVVRVEDLGNGRYEVGVAFAALDKGHKQALKQYIEKKK